VRKFIKFLLVVALMFGGWALAAASLHVVRAPGTMLFGYVPLNVQLIPKNTLTFRETYVDVTRWSVADVEAHNDFVKRLEQVNKQDLLDQAKKTASGGESQPAGTVTVQPQKTADASTSKAHKSIFDFGR
jgi:hypothetical protein